MGGIKGQDNTVDPALYQFISCLFYVSPSIPEIWPDIQKRPEYDVLCHELKTFPKLQMLEFLLKKSICDTQSEFGS